MGFILQTSGIGEQFAAYTHYTERYTWIQGDSPMSIYRQPHIQQIKMG
jgi:hypothetical protein